MIKSIADRHGTRAATAWTTAVLRHQRGIDLAALRSAIASKNIKSIEAVVAASKLQQSVGRVLRTPFTASAQVAGKQSAAILKAHGIAASFNVVHPNVVNFARAQAAQMVVGVPAETRRVIAEVIAQGAQHGLDVAQQARAIREVVGLPPSWASAPGGLAREIRAGEAAAATGRRLSASAKQQIRSRIANGTVTDVFVAEMTEQYAESLINRRALNIARTETLRASHNGLTESWKQAQEQGVLPEAAKRFWIVTPDERLSEEHATIPGMNSNGRGMDEPFETTEGLHMYPPSRPNCRCSVGLLPNVPEDFDVTEGEEAEEEAVEIDEEALLEPPARFDPLAGPRVG
ncbi:MAG: phage minor head protein, partial [Candidatus Rokuibacteriota bacterium]